MKINIKGLAIMAVAALLSFNAHAADTIKLQAATISPPDNLWAKVGDRYAAAVKERTKGKVVIDMAYSGSLGKAAETIEALKFGSVNIVIQEVNHLDVYNPLAGLGAYPYLIRDYDHFKEVMKPGGVGEAFFAEIEKRTGYKLIGSGFRGSREMASRRAIKTPDDLKGLKMRVPNQHTYRLTWETLGASPVPMSSLEVYTSMQQGVIDAAENPLEAHLRSKYYEAVPYVIMTDHVNPYYSFIFDAKQFNGFPEDIQKILTEEGRAAMDWGSQQILAAIGGYKDKLKGFGAKIVEPDKKAFREKLAAMKKSYPEDIQVWIEKFQSVGQ